MPRIVIASINMCLNETFNIVNVNTVSNFPVKTLSAEAKGVPLHAMKGLGGEEI
jgi:hypothetical protein